MNRMLEAKPMVFVRTSGWVWATVAFTVAVAALLACYWPTLQSLVSIWDHDGTYQYAFLIFPLSLWTAFGLRHRLRANAPKPSIWGLSWMIGLVCIWYAGRLFDVNLLQHVAFVAMFPALVLACWGWRALWVLKFPLGYLLFAVPWGDGLVGPLQDFTAHFAVHALELTGTPVLLDGREIVTPSATWMVADACSGVKFFIACSALGCLYAWLMYRRWWKRLLFVALAAVVPIIANGFRVYFTVLIGDKWGLEYATGTDHMIFGWQFFGTVLVLLLLAGWFFRDGPTMPEQPPANDNRVSGARLAIWPAALAVLIAGPLLAAGLVSAPQQEGLRLSAPALAGWSAPQAVTDGWRPEFQGASGQVQAVYRSNTNGNTVDLFHAVYTGKPRRGHSLITYGNDVYDRGKARILESSTRHVELSGRAGITARELRLAGAGGSRLVWYWYCVNQRCNASPVLTKLLQAWSVLRGRMPRSSVWALSAQAGDGDMAAARKNLLAFARALSLADIQAAPRRGESAAPGNVQ
ncbi:MAG: EpsI family protein [Rhodanobacteraceae bacterium]|nr:MAG: EpsI family protein [Rhodanobacteraceae bacterium]